MKTTPLPATIGTGTLCELTGLNDRRHRQLAEEKKIPKCKMSLWPLKATIRGLFDYYRNKQESVSDDQKQATLRKTLADAEKVEMENAEKRKETITIRELRKRLEPIFAAMSTRIQTCSMSEKEKTEMLGFFEQALKALPEGKDETNQHQ